MEQHPFFYKGYTRALLSLLFIAGIVALVSYANLTLREAQTLNMGPTTIQIMGEGEVLAKPDIGTFSFAVQAEGNTATEAQTDSAEAMNAILAYLEAEGVKEDDVKTQNYNLNQKYRYEERVCVSNNYCPPGERVEDGFEVYQNVTVKVRDLENAGMLIAGVGERGATNVSSLQFTVDDESELKAQARAEAIVDAKGKARVLADDLDMKLGRVVNFYENEGYYPSPYYAETKAMGMGGEMMDEASVAPNLPTGENTIRSQVTIVYELK